MVITTKCHNEDMNEETFPIIKCVTEECENMTDMVVCEDCVDRMLPAYERHLERQQGL